METKRILLVGEPMGLLIAKTEGAFEDVDEYQAATCGAELNVAIGLTRLGHQVSYLTNWGPTPLADASSSRWSARAFPPATFCTTRACARLHAQGFDVGG